MQDGDVEEGLPKCMDADLHRATAEGMKKARERALKEDWDVWYLGSLAIDPTYQGKGIGKMLMQWGCEQSDRDGLPLYLEATPAGRGLYEKCGFESVEELTWPGVMHEGESYRMAIMVRKPKRRRVVVDEVRPGTEREVVSRMN